MSYGVVTPTVPVANDIILGEYKVYANYGLPTQLLIGATRGGCKIELDRNIRDIKADGTYGYQLDANGYPLVRYETFDVKLVLEQLYLKYFNRKIISDCESDGTWESQNWGLDGGTYTAETTIVLEGDQSAKCTADTDTYGIHEVFASAKDLTAFDNSETSTTSDYIGFAIYISTQDLTDLSTADIRLSVHKDAEDTVTNYYYYDVEASALTANQWNTFKIAKSSFTEEGSASWSAVTGISFTLNGSPGAEVIFYVDSISLIQAQTNSSIVPLNGHGFSYTDETTYRKWVVDLEITDDDYLENVTVVGQKHDGKKVKFELKNCLNDDKISLAFQEKDEVVNSTTFTAHYNPNSPDTVPISIYEYTA